jgi:hypothetical protein
MMWTSCSRLDLDAAAVEHPRGLRAQRPVHEGLQVADAEHRVAEAAAQPEASQLLDPVGRERLPDAQRQRTDSRERVPVAERADPAVLVVDGRNSPRRCDFAPLAHRVDVLVGRDVDVSVAEAPARLFAEDARRLTALVALDDAAVHVELVAVRPGQRRRVDPQRVRVVGEQRDGHMTSDLVERFLRRLRRPFRVAPAAAAQPLPGLDRADPLPNPGHGLLDRLDPLQPNLPARDGPRREVDVGIVEAREDAPPAQVDPLRPGQRRFVRSDPACDPVSGNRQRRRRRQRWI